MNKWISTGFILLLGLASNAFAASKLSIPSEFEFLAVDGKAISSPLLNRKSSINLPQGQHKVAMRFNDLYEDDITGSHGYIKSSPFVINLLVDGTNNYQLAGVGNQLINDPEKYAKQPKITIRRVDNGKVVYSVKNTQFHEGSLLGEVLGGEAKKDVRAFAVQQTLVHKVHASTRKYQTDSEQTSELQNHQPRKEPVDTEMMLKYWWKKADAKSREQFLIWLQQQK